MCEDKLCDDKWCEDKWCVDKLCEDKWCEEKWCEDKLCVDKLCDDKWCEDKLCVSKLCWLVVGGGGRTEEEAAAGYRTKNKNPTQKMWGKKRGNFNHLSVHWWICSAIRDSQQPTSPIGFLFLKLPPPPCAVLLVEE